MPYFGAGAWVKGLHLNRGVVDLRQCRNGQLPIGHEAHEQNPHHQQRGGDRPQNKRPGDAHCDFPAGWLCCGFSVRRRAPLCGGLPGCDDVGGAVTSAFCGFGGVAGAMVVTTLLPSCNLSCPSTTTTSPAFNPALNPTTLAVVCAKVTG